MPRHRALCLLIGFIMHITANFARSMGSYAVVYHCGLCARADAEGLEEGKWCQSKVEGIKRSDEVRVRMNSIY